MLQHGPEAVAGPLIPVVARGGGPALLVGDQTWTPCSRHNAPTLARPGALLLHCCIEAPLRRLTHASRRLYGRPRMAAYPPSAVVTSRAVWPCTCKN